MPQKVSFQKVQRVRAKADTRLLLVRFGFLCLARRWLVFAGGFTGLDAGQKFLGFCREFRCAHLRASLIIFSKAREPSRLVSRLWSC